jgi:hypothetical protein
MTGEPELGYVAAQGAGTIERWGDGHRTGEIRRDMLEPYAESAEVYGQMAAAASDCID